MTAIKRVAEKGGMGIRDDVPLIPIRPLEEITEDIKTLEEETRRLMEGIFEG